jgi:hypothetical protein
MKQLKYLMKAVVLSYRPDWYWSARRMLLGPIEPELELMGRFRSIVGVFLDVGASWGAYSHAAAENGFRVHAFEPQARVADVLARGLTDVRGTSRRF